MSFTIEAHKMQSQLKYAAKAVTRSRTIQKSLFGNLPGKRIHHYQPKKFSQEVFKEYPTKSYNTAS